MKRLSRFVSIRLSVFLVLVSAACLAVGIFAERWHRRQRAAAVIQEYRGRIHWSTDDPSLVWFRRAERIYLSSKRSPEAQRRALSEARQQLDKAFSALKGFPELQELFVDDPAFDDSQLQHVSHLRNLRSLYIGSDCAVTGSGLQYLPRPPLFSAGEVIPRNGCKDSFGTPDEPNGRNRRNLRPINPRILESTARSFCQISWTAFSNADILLKEQEIVSKAETFPEADCLMPERRLKRRTDAQSDQEELRCF